MQVYRAIALLFPEEGRQLLHGPSIHPFKLLCSAAETNEVGLAVFVVAALAAAAESI